MKEAAEETTVELAESACMTLADLNALDADAAVQAFLRCCGSSRWAQHMAPARPFASAAGAGRRGRSHLVRAGAADWLEAFAAHPQIGERRHGNTAAWAAAEQAGVADADGQTRRRLAEANQRYEARFGYIFIVCATGRSADEMLALLEARLRHDPDANCGLPREEQRKITRLRLGKLLEQEPRGMITTHVLDIARGEPAQGSR